MPLVQHWLGNNTDVSSIHTCLFKNSFQTGRKGTIIYLSISLSFYYHYESSLSLSNLSKESLSIQDISLWNGDIQDKYDRSLKSTPYDLTKT